MRKWLSFSFFWQKNKKVDKRRINPMAQKWKSMIPILTYLSSCKCFISYISWRIWSQTIINTFIYILQKVSCHRMCSALCSNHRATTKVTRKQVWVDSCRPGMETQNKKESKPMELTKRKSEFGMQAYIRITFSFGDSWVDCFSIRLFRTISRKSPC